MCLKTSHLTCMTCIFLNLLNFYDPLQSHPPYKNSQGSILITRSDSDVIMTKNHFYATRFLNYNFNIAWDPRKVGLTDPNDSGPWGDEILTKIILNLHSLNSLNYLLEAVLSDFQKIRYFHFQLT